ncbi:MAG: nitroreductase family protein [Armatimonadetes bacterium]|nr:nitroreductase family protein [Armatimonadota bacterium]
MTVMEAIEKRYSVRGYLDQPVEPEKVARVMEAARLAPSANNKQEWRFVLVSDPERREALARAAGQAFVGTAPVVIVACAADTSRIMRCGVACHPVDVAIALEHIALQATAEGLGTCWIGAFDQEAVKRVIGAPTEAQVIELMPLGYAATTPPPKSRLPMSEIVFDEVWR